MFDDAQLDKLEHWIFEREAIRMRKEELHRAKPWTDDIILRHNRFCNVRRMDDKVSRWLLENWYAPIANADARTVITMATLARHINWPDALAELKPGKWNATKVRAALDKRWDRGDKVFTGAYIINGAGSGSKIAQVVERVDSVWLWAGGQRVHHSRYTTMATLHGDLMGVHGIGSFMAGQIVADLRYTHVLANATDAMAWAPRGPGSTRGMNRLLGRTPLHLGFKDAQWQLNMQMLWRILREDRKLARGVLRSRRCELMDLQNCLCEFDKYMRILNGEGRARNRYPGV